MKLFIPENLELLAFEKKYQPELYIQYYKTDKLAYILHQLNHIPLYDRRYQKEGQFIPLSSKILQDRIGNFYSQYLAFLLHTGIIDTDSQYIVKEKSIGYRIAYPYNQNIKEYIITDFMFKNNLRNYYIANHKKIQKDYKFLIKWFDKLEINEELAMQFIREDYQIKEFYPELRDRDDKEYKSASVQYKLAKKAIEKYSSKEYLDFSIDQSGHRFHSILTNTRSTLRHALTYENKALATIDIKNSQPYFSTQLFKKDFWKHASKNKKYKKLLIRYNIITILTSSLCFPELMYYLINLMFRGTLH